MQTLNQIITKQNAPLYLAENGAVIRVKGTRIPLEMVVGLYLRGESAEQIVEEFPTLRVSDVLSVFQFYKSNAEVVNAYIAAQEKEAEAIWTKIESDPRNVELRDKIRVRRVELLATPARK